jgi:hypothetical protein
MLSHNLTNGAGGIRTRRCRRPCFQALLPHRALLGVRKESNRRQPQHHPFSHQHLPLPIPLPHSSPSFISAHLLAAVDEVIPQCCPVSRPGLLPRPRPSDSPPRSPGAMSPLTLPARTSKRARFPPRTTSLSPSACPMSPSRPTRWTRPHTTSPPPRRS